MILIKIYNFLNVSVPKNYSIWVWGHSEKSERCPYLRAVLFELETPFLLHLESQENSGGRQITDNNLLCGNCNFNNLDKFGCSDLAGIYLFSKLCVFYGINTTKYFASYHFGLTFYCGIIHTHKSFSLQF